MKENPCRSITYRDRRICIRGSPGVGQENAPMFEEALKGGLHQWTTSRNPKS
jgi:hypothetical protein